MTFSPLHRAAAALFLALFLTTYFIVPGLSGISPSRRISGAELIEKLQAEIDANRREVARIVAEENEKNTVPPLIVALEKVLEEDRDADRNWEEYVHANRHPLAAAAVTGFAMRAQSDAAKVKLFKALIVQTRTNEKMFETISAQINAINVRVAALVDEHIDRTK